jgi:hypothetical protein
MKKRLLATILLSLMLLLALSVTVCHAATGKKKLLLFAKNPKTWQIVKEGGSGKMVYHAASGAFTLKATGLRPAASYALIRYADTPPQVEILARGTADGRGRLELAGNWREWTKKFWLVAGEDVQGSPGATGTMTAWRPERYLFEEKPLGIPCACPEPDEP